MVRLHHRRDYSIDEKKEAVLSLLRLGCIRPSVKTPGLDYQAWNCSGLDRQEILSAGQKNFRYRLVQQGVTARNFGNAVSGPKRGPAISTPGHFACGTLIF